MCLAVKAMSVAIFIVSSRAESAQRAEIIAHAARIPSQLGADACICVGAVEHDVGELGVPPGTSFQQDRSARAFQGAQRTVFACRSEIIGVGIQGVAVLTNRASAFRQGIGV